MSTNELYGVSPIMAALADLKAFNALPADERAAIARAHVERELRHYVADSPR